MYDLTWATYVKTFLSLFLCRPLTLVEGLPAAAAHDKEPWVGIPVSEKEERVSALAGSSPESGFVWEWGAQEWEWQPQETAGGSAVWGERLKVTALPICPDSLHFLLCTGIKMHNKKCRELSKASLESGHSHESFLWFAVCNLTQCLPSPAEHNAKCKGPKEESRVSHGCVGVPHASGWTNEVSIWNIICIYGALSGCLLVFANDGRYCRMIVVNCNVLWMHKTLITGGKQMGSPRDSVVLTMPLK